MALDDGKTLRIFFWLVETWLRFQWPCHSSLREFNNFKVFEKASSHTRDFGESAFFATFMTNEIQIKNWVLFSDIGFFTLFDRGILVTVH